jgi:hypothetical protein
MFFMTLAVVTAACLFLPFTRLYGVIGALITLYFYPYHTLTSIGVILLGGGRLLVPQPQEKTTCNMKTTSRKHWRWSRPGTFRMRNSPMP